MSNILLYDTADGAFQGGVPDNAQSVLYYYDGAYANGSAARRRFQHLFTQKRTVSLTDLLTGPSGYHADGCDSETGNGGTDAAVRYVENAIKLGVWRPVVYSFTSRFTDGGLLAALERLLGPLGPPGPNRKIRVYPAHPATPHGLHICGPHICGAMPIDCDGAQSWWGQYEGGGRVDEDHGPVLDSFFKPLVVPDPMHYVRYDNTHRPALHVATGRTERSVAQRYDVLRATQTPTLHPHRHEIALLRTDAALYRDRIGHLMVVNAPKGKRLETKRENWGWRYWRLDQRVKGATVHPG